MTSLNQETGTDRWFQLSLVEQLANVGSEVHRMIGWQARGDRAKADTALTRALNLLDATLDDSRWSARRSELVLLREAVCASLGDETGLRVSPDALERYFLPFALAARRTARLPYDRPKIP